MNMQGTRSAFATSVTVPIVIVLSLIMQMSSLLSAARAQCDPEEIAKLLPSDGAADDYFGVSVSINGDGSTAVVGASYDDDNGSYSGSAYVFRFNGSEWVEEAKLLASDGAPDDFFGASVSISNDGSTALVGEPYDDDNGSYSGSAYIFRFNGSEWTEEAKLLPADGAPSDFFGYSVAIGDDGSKAIVGAYGSSDSGSAYIFRFNGSEWIEEGKLRPADGAPGDYFGYSVSISDDGSATNIGAYYDDDNGKSSGSAYIFRFNGSRWLEEAKLLASDGASEDYFGTSVAIDSDGRVAIVSAAGDDDFGSTSGSAYVFRFNGSQWIEEKKLLASDGDASDGFGWSVSISEQGTTVIVGVYADGDNGPESGSAIVFQYNGSEWIEDAKLLASDGAYSDHFGVSVAISDDASAAIIGAYGDDVNGYRSGSAYIFELNCVGPCLTLAVDNLVAGKRAWFTLTDGTPGASTVTVYGLQPGQTVVNGTFGYCATFGIRGVNQKKVVGGLNRMFDANGEISFSIFVPFALRGRTFYFQSAMQGTCPDECMSNMIRQTVQ